MVHRGCRCPTDALSLLAALECGQRNGPWQEWNVSRLHAVQLRCSHSFVSCSGSGNFCLSPLVSCLFIPVSWTPKKGTM